METKLITDLIYLGTQIVENPNPDKVRDMLKSLGVKSIEAEALIESLCCTYSRERAIKIMDIQYRGKPLKFCSYCTIEDKNPIWIAQTRADEYGCTLQIWQVDENYYICIG